MKTLLTLATLIFLPFLSNAQEVTCNDDCKTDLIESYLNDIVKIFVLGSKVDDIDTFLSQLHNDIKYEHKEYDADFTKLKWRKAFIRQHEKGFYQEQRRMQGKILNIIYGKNHAAVEYSYGFLDKDGHWKKDHVKFALFGFKESKISLVREYW
ncbi:hypothetical protein [Paraglaciecola sp.]|uniref:hypothetical protein n=1 Tax=Paraglaciecola sp. TaxID=1920173 RepID=UPI003265C50A